MLLGQRSIPEAELRWARTKDQFVKSSWAPRPQPKCPTIEASSFSSRYRRPVSSFVSVLEKRHTSRTGASEFRSGMTAISSPVPVAWYPALAVLTVAVGLMLTASFFIYEATASTRSRSLAKEITTAAVASVFLGFGSLFVLLASGVYV
uniref:Uncharacterized protein n=1 Tax=Avena sativa TaxID=4498 RepID=A0ACD5Z8I8_AVESA